MEVFVCLALDLREDSYKERRELVHSNKGRGTVCILALMPALSLKIIDIPGRSVGPNANTEFRLSD